MLRFIEGESENGLLLWLLAKYELHELAEKYWLIHQCIPPLIMDEVLICSCHEISDQIMCVK